MDFQSFCIMILIRSIIGYICFCLFPVRVRAVVFGDSRCTYVGTRTGTGKIFMAA